MVTGRLLTDESFRETCQTDPHRALSELLERGLHLTRADIAALIATALTLSSAVNFFVVSGFRALSSFS